MLPNSGHVFRYLSRFAFLHGNDRCHLPPDNSASSREFVARNSCSVASLGVQVGCHVRNINGPFTRQDLPRPRRLGFPLALMLFRKLNHRANRDNPLILPLTACYTTR